MSDNSQNTAEQAEAFQKIWTESISRILQAAMTLGPNTAPPEVLREIRSGILQALARSWEEFMRSPQFLDGMRQWMDNAVTFRQMTNDFMANVRSEMQGTSRDDIDTVMLAIRHMEKRVLDRVEELSAEVTDLKRRADNGRPGGRMAADRKAKGKGVGTPRKSRRGKPRTKAL